MILGIRAMKDALLPLGNMPLMKNSSKNLMKSGFRISQNCLIKLKFKPSGSGLLSPPQAHTADFISTSENLATRLSFCPWPREGNWTPSRVGLEGFCSENLCLKWLKTAILTLLGSWTHPPSMNRPWKAVKHSHKAAIWKTYIRLGTFSYLRWINKSTPETLFTVKKWEALALVRIIYKTLKAQ